MKTKQKSRAKIFLGMIISAGLASLIFCTAAANSLRQEPPLPVDGNNPLGVLTYPVVDTGQIKFYDNRTEIELPVLGNIFFGQDANYHGFKPNYKDNSDGTVTDMNTGLM